MKNARLLQLAARCATSRDLRRLGSQTPFGIAQWFVRYLRLTSALASALLVIVSLAVVLRPVKDLTNVDLAIVYFTTSLPFFVAGAVVSLAIAVALVEPQRRAGSGDRRVDQQLQMQTPAHLHHERTPQRRRFNRKVHGDDRDLSTFARKRLRYRFADALSACRDDRHGSIEPS